MAEPRRPAWWKLASLLVAAALLVGTVVAAVSVGTAAPMCAGGENGEPCRELVVTLARRSGLVAGATAVVMVLLAAGLMRMLAQDDRARAQLALESSRAASERK